MSLDRSGKWNPGGGSWLEVVPAVAIQEYARSTVAAAPTVTLRSGWTWKRIYCTQGTLQYRDQTKETENGYLHELEIRGFAPDDSAGKAMLIDELLQYRRFLVRFRDNAELTRLAGTPVESLLMEMELGTDSEVPGQRGYQLNFTGTLTAPAAYE
ncbi:hypothetical protein [Larkinella soli]|uniref:hypothetical protein n=1 Tax=Larkinella soli TaxID=1770527 RepID=UPI000FFC0766|nr:hypothetical protein [Larkinella soli]